MLGLLAFDAGLSEDWPRLALAGLGAGAYGIAMLALWGLARGALGAGDVKLAPLIGAVSAWAGPWTAILWTPLAIALLGAVAGAVARRRGREDLAFGPAMLLGCWLGLGAGAMLG